MLCKAPESVRKFGQVEDWESYAVLCQEGTVEQVTTWNDVKEFGEMHAALHDLGFTHDQRGQLYTMVAIVLQLGNVNFRDADTGEGAAVATPEQFQLTVDLLQVNREKMLDALTMELVTFGKDQVIRELSRKKAENARNALCAHVYSLAFDWCVRKINDAIAQPEGEVHRCIGVLDIFGFENFDLNSFPQLCINLTNERLHHLFIEHIFEVTRTRTPAQFPPSFLEPPLTAASLWNAIRRWSSASTRARTSSGPWSITRRTSRSSTSSRERAGCSLSSTTREGKRTNGKI